MIREINLAEARKNFGEIVNEVRYRHDNILLHKSGKPVAALVNIELFNKMQQLELNLKQYIEELAKTYESISASIAESEIQEAVKSLKD